MVDAIGGVLVLFSTRYGCTYVFREWANCWKCLYGYTPFYAHTRFDTKVKIAVSVDIFRGGIYECLTRVEPSLLPAVPSCPSK